jgi:DNA-binding response OmpR family regulator
MEDLILLAEDDEQFGEALSVFLEDNGLSVIWAKDGETAIRLYKELNPRLILLDVVLPGKDGFEVAVAIRKLNTALPIIFMTGTALDMENFDKAYQSLHANNYIEKPVNLHNALAQIRSLLHPVGTLRKYSIKNHHITVDSQQLTIDNKAFQFRDNEIQVISILLDNVDSVVTRDYIMNKVWNENKFQLYNILDTAISHIKKGLKDVPCIEINTVYSVGYSL